MLINKITPSYTVEQSGEFTRNIFVKNQKVTFKGIKYKPMRTDTVKLSSKTNIIADLLDKLSQISAMRENGMTQEQIAEILGIGRGKLQGFLKKYLPNVSTKSIRFREATRQFLSAGSEREQNKAFEAVDEVLQQIAKEKTKSNNCYAYEDYLQDLRLKFLEITTASRGRRRALYEQMLQKLKAEPEPVSDKLVKVSLSKLDEGAFTSEDLETRMFEDNDFCDELIARSGLSKRHNIIARLDIIDDKSVNEIAKHLHSTSVRTKKSLKQALELIKQKHKQVTSEAYLQQRIELIQNILREILARQ